MEIYRFPEQKIIRTENQFSRQLLDRFLEQTVAASSPFTGYLKLVGDDAAVYFLFFLNSAPYAAGRYSGSKPVSYTIRELGAHLAGSASESMTVTLCQTDPVLLKCMLLFLQEEPTIKTPTMMIDLDYIVRQIGDAGANALITLKHENSFSFFFFKQGKGAVAHYGDREYERPEGMTVEEEMLLYAFQPGAKVDAYIFRDMQTAEAEDAGQLDRSSLLDILAGGGVAASTPAAPSPSVEKASTIGQKTKPPTVVLTVEAGPQKGARFTVTLPCTIGRKESDIILDDSKVSRRHAELKIIESKLFIADLGSTNGTRVNGDPVSLKQLSPNDLILFGETCLRITPA